MHPISSRTNKVLLIICLLAIGFGVFAQAPNLLNYQGVARNAVGNPLPNQAMNLRLSVHNLSASGTVVYSETRPITTNLGGLFSVQIGSAGTTSSTGTIGGVNWLSGDKFLQVEIDPISNNNYLNLGTVQLVTVPYAFNAASAGNATTATKLAAPKNINGVAFDGSADISIAAAASAELLTGTNIKSTVTGSSLTSLGTLTNLTVTNPIAGSVTGNAATATLASTVTTNANLSGDVTSVGNVTSVKQINGTALSGLSTGILKNTTTTGVPSIAVAGTDYLTPTGSAAGLTNFPTFNQKTSGNAATATKLETPKNINGVSFDGTGDITVTADAGTLIGNTLKSTVTGSSLTSLGTLTNLTVTNPIAGSVTGNAATATKLATPKNINGVAFDGSSDITIGAAAAAEQLTGTILKSTVTGSSLTSVGTLTNLTVTNPIAGSVTGNAASATNLTGLTTSVATLNNLSGVNTGDQTTITGNAATATKLAATKNINGVAFDGSSDITIGAAAAAEQLTGTTLKSTVTGSSLTSVGTLANLTVTNPIVGSITGNAATATTATTVTTNANLTGDVTSVGNATTIADNAVTTAKIANANVTLAKLENLASGAIIVGNTSNRPTAVSISGDAVLSPTGELIITTGAITTSKIATSAVATASIADGAITNAKVTDVAASKITGTFTSATVNGKVIVGASSAASASAVLEASSTTQGFLPPRMTFDQRNAISSVVAGLVVWCSDCGNNGELQVHNGTAWKNMIGGTASIVPPKVGDAYQGGIIAYILVSGDPGYVSGEVHGLIAATSDQSTGIDWFNNRSFTTTGATGTAIGTGLSNTNTIITSQGATSTSYAAGLARAYNGGGYFDWYLPSKDELAKLYAMKVLGFGGFGSWFYWSSTENGLYYAWGQNFSDGSWESSGSNKGSTSFDVRAIRAF